MFSWLQPWTPSEYLNDGEAVNTISLSINYDRLQVYANGRLLWGDTDVYPLDAGAIGVGGYSGNAPKQKLNDHLVPFVTKESFIWLDPAKQNEAKTQIAEWKKTK